MNTPKRPCEPCEGQKRDWIDHAFHVAHVPCVGLLDPWLDIHSLVPRMVVVVVVVPVVHRIVDRAAVPVPSDGEVCHLDTGDNVVVVVPNE